MLDPGNNGGSYGCSLGTHGLHLCIAQWCLYHRVQAWHGSCVPTGSQVSGLGGEEAEVNCSKCRQPMRSGEQDGKPIMACLPCGSVIQLPMAGATVQHSPASRKASIREQGPVNPKLPSEGEVSFIEAWRDYVPSVGLMSEYKFHNFREWRLDFAHPESRVAIEFEGYGHQKDNRYKSDLDKYNALAFEGWALFRCTKAMVEKDAERLCRMVAECIRKRLSNA